MQIEHFFKEFSNLPYWCGVIIIYWEPTERLGKVGILTPSWL